MFTTVAKRIYDKDILCQFGFERVESDQFRFPIATHAVLSGIMDGASVNIGLTDPVNSVQSYQVVGTGFLAVKATSGIGYSTLINNTAGVGKITTQNIQCERFVASETSQLGIAYATGVGYLADFYTNYLVTKATVEGVSPAGWAYLATINQALSKTSSAEFNSLKVTTITGGGYLGALSIIVGTMTVNGNISASYLHSDHNVEADGEVRAGTGVLAVTGDITAADGDISAPNGAVSCGGSVTTGVGFGHEFFTENGGFRSDHGGVLVGANIKTTNGTISTDIGNVHTNKGNLNTSDGDIGDTATGYSPTIIGLSPYVINSFWYKKIGKLVTGTFQFSGTIAGGTTLVSFTMPEHPEGDLVVGLATGSLSGERLIIKYDSGTSKFNIKNYDGTAITGIGSASFNIYGTITFYLD